MNILLIEDDAVIGKALVQGFTEAGHPCQWAKDGIAGETLATSQEADAIVLDMNLPGRDGMEVLRGLREAGIRTPVVVLTARGGVDERVHGLNSGADDYMAKPFDFAELLARVVAVCRRAAPRPSMTMLAGGVRLDLSNRRVQQGEREVDLTPTEFSILELLMRNAGQTVTRRMLCEHVWGFNWDGTTNVIEVHINRLRGKLEPRDAPPLIHTVRGRGYAFRALDA